MEPISMRRSGTTNIEAFRITGASANPCVLNGMPSVIPYRAGGASVQAQVVPIPPGEGVVGSPGVPITLARGETAVFFVQWSPAPPPDICQDVTGLLFNAPGETGPPAQVPFGIRFCGRLLRTSAVLPAGTA